MNAMTLALNEGGGTFGAPLVSQILAFLILLFVIGKWGVPWLRSKVDARAKEVGDEFDRLGRETRDVSERLEALKRRLGEIEAESQRRIQAALAEGARLRDQALADAQAQASAELNKARRDVQIERDKAVLELRQQVTELTVAATEKVIDSMMNEQIHGRMVGKYIANLGKAVPVPSRVEGKAP